MALDTASRRPVLENVMPESEGPPYKCLICDPLLPRNRYSNYNVYQQHLLKKHNVDTRVRKQIKGATAERPIVCDVCGLSWKSKHDLRHHISRVHKVEAPPSSNPKVVNLECIVCLKTMKRLHYNEHLKTEHNIDLQIEKLSFESKDGKSVV